MFTRASFHFLKDRSGEKILKILRLPASNQIGTNTLFICPTPSVSETLGVMIVSIKLFLQLVQKMIMQEYLDCN